MNALASNVEHLSQLLGGAGQVCVFTGAGISTESGIADFRSPGGIWSQIKPIQFDSFLWDEEARLEDWRRRFYFKAQYESVAPNDGHRAVRQLLAAKPGSKVVTQNIDGLHQRSGVAEDDVIELHGSGLKASCLKCHAPMTLEAAYHCVEEQGTAPRCAQCGGLVKADVISFGQPMPQDKVRAALACAMECDVMLVLGSSLVVQPAASVPERAVLSGARLAIVNNDPTPLDDLASVAIHAPIGTVMRAAMRSVV